MMICMLEHALQYYPESVRICSWLLKIYSKLGLASLVTDLVDKFPFVNDLNSERLGAARFSVYSDYGMNDALDELISQQKDFYRDKINENKNLIVQSFLQRDFEKIQPTMEKNEHLSKSGFQHAIGIGETILAIGKYATVPAKLNQVFTKQFDHIDVICDTEYNFNSRVMPSATFDQRILKTLRLQDIKPLKLG